MYTEAGHPYFTQDVQSVESFEELICGFQKPNSHNNLSPSSNEVHGGAQAEEGMSCDPVSFAISLLSCGEYAMFSMKESYPALNTDMFSMKESYPEEGGLSLDNSSTDSVYMSSFPPNISAAAGPSFLDFQGIQFEIASEGGMQVQTSSINSHPERRSNNAMEERLQKLSRYRKKKCKRNFGKTIKYACRKVLADSQPRVRGRFAKTSN